MTTWNNCCVCDVIYHMNHLSACRCLDCNYHFCTPSCAGFEIALAPGIPAKDIAFIDGTGYIVRNCVICRGIAMNDTIAYGYLLEVIGMSRETALSFIRGHFLNGGMHKSK